MMGEAVDHHDEMVVRIPELEIEDNAKKLADSIEEVCLTAKDRKVSISPLGSKA